MKRKAIIFILILQWAFIQTHAQLLREYGIEIGVFPTGETNTITDVPSVKVGHKTLVEGENVRTGVTAIIPADGNLFNKNYLQRFTFTMALENLPDTAR